MKLNRPIFEELWYSCQSLCSHNLRCQILHFACSVCFFVLSISAYSDYKQGFAEIRLFFRYLWFSSYASGLVSGAFKVAANCVVARRCLRFR
ncbi:hypothetical protein VNO80_16878 [Phaseolus coccineus]|uniref:Uncharacterized protein n=1 Tax=Phaseolus coccineus TaxID=3886 RepID=A0AAN9MMK7_PHACN